MFCRVYFDLRKFTYLYLRLSKYAKIKFDEEKVIKEHI